MSDGTLTERERLVYSAKLAEQAERYDGAFSVRRRAFARARGLLNSTRCQPSRTRLRLRDASSPELVVVREEVLDADPVLVHAIFDLRG
jgi:hypothetical protein